MQTIFEAEREKTAEAPSYRQSFYLGALTLLGSALPILVMALAR